jgi:hypothetical protein
MKQTLRVYLHFIINTRPAITQAHFETGIAAAKD